MSYFPVDAGVRIVYTRVMGFIMKNRVLLLFQAMAYAGLAATLLMAAFVYAESRDPYAAWRPVCHLRVGNIEGSGFAIAGDDDNLLVLTCRHVASRVGQQVQVHWPAAGGQPSIGYVHSHVPPNAHPPSSIQCDMATVICPRPVGVTPLARSKLRSHEYAIAGGWRDGLLRTTYSDNVSLKAGLYTMEGAYFVKGMSGGPVLDKYGRWFAIVSTSDFATVGIAADGSCLDLLLKQYK